MADRIYVTYTPTTAPGSYHTAIHYERTDPAGNVIQHFVIEAKPEKLDQLSALDKATGVIEEAFRNDDGPSRFGRINATVNEMEASDDPNVPYENIAEGEDLSENFARMQLFAHGFNRAGFAYRGDHQNSNTFAGAALRAGELPPATGVAHDPAGPPGELLEFFAPGSNEPLRAPIGQHSSFEPARSPVQKYARSAAPNGSASTSAQGAPPATPAFQPDIAGKGAVPVLSRVGKFIGNSLITPAEAASPSRPLSQGPTAPNLPSEESAFGDRPENAPGGPRPDTYPRLRSRRVSSAFPDIAPHHPNQPVPPSDPGPPLGIFSGKPMSLSPLPPSVWGLPDNSDASGNGDWFNFLAGIASRNPTPPAPPPPTAGSKPARYLSRRTVDQSQASVFDTGAPAVPFVPSDDPNFSGGLLGRLVALMGIDPQNPTPPAPPPLDDGLRGFYRDDPVQPWFVQRQR
jgi:hypothetical protein